MPSPHARTAILVPGPVMLQNTLRTRLTRSRHASLKFDARDGEVNPDRSGHPQNGLHRRDVISDVHKALFDEEPLAGSWEDVSLPPLPIPESELYGSSIEVGGPSLMTHELLQRTEALQGRLVTLETEVQRNRQLATNNEAAISQAQQQMQVQSEQVAGQLGQLWAEVESVRQEFVEQAAEDLQALDELSESLDEFLRLPPAPQPAAAPTMSIAPPVRAE